MAVCFRRLRHNRTDLLLAFVVPIAFFSIFALIFGSAGGVGTTPQFKVLGVDTVESPASRQLLRGLQATPGLRFLDTSPTDSPEDSQAKADAAPGGQAVRQRRSVSQAEAMVRRGTASVAIVIRSQSGGGLQIDLLSDPADRIAPHVVTALVQRAMLSTSNPQAATAPAASAPAVSPVRVVDVVGDHKSNPVVSMYAAGIAVMFLLFGATAGGGALLEERENQTLDRLLTTGLTMDQLLLGKWLYLTLLGVAQTTLMFAWGQAMFGIDLLAHFDGFLIMTLVTAGAAAAFGLLLATLCRSRAQLNGLSVVVVLSMSALGGSMVPRYVMSPALREAGQWTFNAWALDGYDKVFWRELPVGELWPQMSVLMLCGASFLVIARVLAIRWETQ